MPLDYTNPALPTGRAICYSGYRDGQSPDAAIFPSPAEILEDLRLLRPHFTLLRLYDCTPHAERVLQVIREHGLPFQVLLGAWLAAEVNNPGCPWGGQHSAEQLATNVRANEAEVERLITLAQAHESRVCAVAVGNEATVGWTDHLVPVPRVIELVQQVKRRLPQPVTMCENHVPWTDGHLDSLVPELDFISLHTYPLWEHQPVHQALAVTQADVQRIAARHPGKPLAITEAGWATRSNGRGMPAHHANGDAQVQYLRELQAWCQETGLPCFWFEAFDEAWKGSPDPLEPEKHWGLYTTARAPKPAVQVLLPA